MPKKTTKEQAARARLDGARLELDGELAALDREVIGQSEGGADHLPRAIGLELGATLLRLEAHGHRYVAETLAARYGTTAEEMQYWAREFSSELIAAKAPRVSLSAKAIQNIIDDLDSGALQFWRP